MSDELEKRINFLVALVAGTATAIICLFTLFETKADALDRRNSIEARLIRIEEKLDKALGFRR